MYVHFVSGDPDTSDVSTRFERSNATLSVSRTVISRQMRDAQVDGLLYDYTTRGTDEIAAVRRFRAERPSVPIIGVVDTITTVCDVPTALEPLVDGWIVKDAVRKDPRRALSALRHAAEHSRETRQSDESAIRSEANGCARSGDAEGVLVAADASARLEDPLPRDNRQALRAKNRRLSTLADTLSHDLPNPLMVASEYADLAHETGDEEYLTRADNAIDRASKLIDELLTLAQTGQGIVTLLEVPIATAASDTWDSIETGSATLELETDRIVRGDPRLIHRLFEAVFDNSIEHGDPDVSIHVGTHDTGFYIEDDGPGVSLEHRDALRSSAGTDLAGTGFTVIRDVTTAHGWELAVEEATTGGLRLEFTV